MKINSYYHLLRVNHWFKNAFIFPGAILALVLNGGISDPLRTLAVLLGTFILASLVSSANYIVNQIADSKFDARHPDKKDRPIPSGQISVIHAVYSILILLVISGTLAYYFFSVNFLLILLALGIAGVVYNIKPVRLKDIPYIDVISESFNNPLRFLLGWFAVSHLIYPPLVVLLFTWTLGALFMTAKRYDELNFYGKKLVPYRHTFNTYSLTSLSTMMNLYATLTIALLSYLFFIYQKSLLLGAPFLVMFFVWMVNKVRSGEAKTREVESFVFHHQFLAYAMATLLFFVFLYLIN